jgi:hypothetical protein
VLLFVTRLNVRFASNWEYLEALTVVNPATAKKTRNKAQSGAYVAVLLTKYPLPANQRVLYTDEAIINSMHTFFELREDQSDLLFRDGEPKTRYYGHVFTRRVDLAPWAMFSVHCLRLLLTTVSVETRFTTMNQRQGKGNTQLRDGALRAAFVLRDSARSVDVNWPVLLEEIKAYRLREAAAGRPSKVPVPRGIYKSTRLKRLGQDCWNDAQIRFTSDSPLRKKVRRAQIKEQRKQSRAKRHKQVCGAIQPPAVNESDHSSDSEELLSASDSELV